MIQINPVRRARVRSVRRMTVALAVLCMGCATLPAAAPSSPGTLVAIFAHPDDETIVSPALARYAREGTKVYVVIATDGRLGVSAHAGVPGGDSLATVRAGEARCSASALGAQPPILLGFADAGLAVGRPWPGEPMDRMAKQIEAKLRELGADAVITWGPEGGYGHADHRLVGDVVTQLFQAGAVAESTKLYYVGFTADRIAQAPRWYGMRMYPTAPALLTARVAYEDRDRDAGRRSMECHRSQATAEQMNESFTTLERLWQGQVAFQQWRGGAVRTRLF